MKQFHNSVDENEQNLKITIIAIIIFLTFIIYAVKLYSLQVVGGSTYRRQSQIISSTTRLIAAQRGEIYDRNASFPLVINTDSFAVDMTTAEIPDGYYDTVAARLASFLGIKKSDIDKKFSSNRAKKSYQSVEVRSGVPFSIISDIAENINDLPGVSWRSKPVRNYVEIGSISHVIGYVGNITKDELKVLYNKGYKEDSIIGKMGIEKQYDSLMQGTNGREIRTVDAKGHVISDVPIIEAPEMGKSLVLTIDMRIQELVEKALGERVGAAVVLRPYNGEVLAMVSYPFYDQNIFSSNDAADKLAKLVNDANQPFINRVISAVYPPASTFKTIMTTALLSENAISPAEKIECTGKIEYGGRTFHCHQLWGHGYLDLKNALAQSCDVYYWVTGRDNLGVDKIASYAKEFGFGESLEIDLPGAKVGTLPTPAWKEKTFNNKWNGGDTFNMSIGQGYTLVTPMHVANMMAMVVNSGKIYKPHILKDVLDSSGKVISSTQPEILHESNIDNSVWKEVQADLRYMITHGTATFPFDRAIVKLAGKTGTAETNQKGIRDKAWHSWMVAYGPYDAPVEDQLVVAVIVEAVNVWEWWAPYATNLIFQGIFGNQTYEQALAALPNVRYVLNNREKVGRQE